MIFGAGECVEAGKCWGFGLSKAAGGGDDDGCRQLLTADGGDDERVSLLLDSGDGAAGANVDIELGSDSRTTGHNPRSRSARAAARPDWPAPMTMAS